MLGVSVYIKLSRWHFREQTLHQGVKDVDEGPGWLTMERNLHVMDCCLYW